MALLFCSNSAYFESLIYAYYYAEKHINISSNHYKGIHQPCIKIAGVLVNLTVRLSSLSEWAEYKDLVPAVMRPGELILVLLDNACDSIRGATAYFRSVPKAALHSAPRGNMRQV